ncbi:vascular endothelial growth factor receptor 3 isoform X1 [Amblyraja radiata]|uniref:vascular endothelial growth factor receptor 3 isoform X1 n=2 Tax=Amblyraja radiata TaxID=386614 RepID=UPI001402CA22|nr:vascular endothelial growth factor receptor 3 isoform X1 [Amblyraja radiata]
MKGALGITLWIYVGALWPPGLIRGSSMTAPTIVNVTGTEYSITAGGALSITCRGQSSLGWSCPGKVSVEEDSKSPLFRPEEAGGRSVSVKDCKGSPAQQYCKTLVLTRARASDTGYYRCHYHFAGPIVDGVNAISVYIFVKDLQSPFLSTSPNGTLQPQVLIVNSSLVTVPCLVTIPSLNVTLREDPTSVIYPDGVNVFWDNRKGMIIPRQRLDNLLYVTCETVVGARVFSSALYIIQAFGRKIYNIILTVDRPHLLVGERLVLNCTVEAEFNVAVHFDWAMPRDGIVKGDPSVVRRNHKRTLETGVELSSSLTLYNVSMADRGIYTCKADNSFVVEERTIEVVVHERPFIVLEYSSGPVVQARLGQRGLVLRAGVRAYPPAVFQWLKDGQPVRSGGQGKPSLDIGEVTEQVAGVYTLLARNPRNHLQEELQIRLVVNVPPQIHEKEVASPTNIYPKGSRQTLTCTVYGVPTPPRVLWQWRPWGPCGLKSHRSLGRRDTAPRHAQDRTHDCQDWRNISAGRMVNNIESIETSTEMLEGRNKTVSKLVILAANISVMYKCSAFNKVGHDDRVIYFYVTSIPEGFGIELQPSEAPVEGQRVQLRCSADNYTYENVQWYRLLPSALEGELGDPPVLECRNMHRYARRLPAQVTTDPRVRGLALELHINSIAHSDEGDYVCEVQNRKTGEKHCHRKYLLVRAQERPGLLDNLTDLSINVSASMEMRCRVTGSPLPSVAWFKDDKRLHQISGVVFSELNQTLTVQRVQIEDAGVYRCIACNSKGCINSSAVVTVEGADDKSNIEVVILVGTGVIAIFFWILLILIFCNVKRVRFLGTSPADIKTGYLSIIVDPDEIPLDEQSEYLPYDSTKWEFPRARLRLGKILGHGAFGKVVEASAFGIDKSSSCRTVAVKMLKNGATANEHKALMSELKILIHIGNHLNVVNLLGACTKANGPLMVIVEYCRYGNLSNYLRNKREDFIPCRERVPMVRSQMISMVEVVKGLENRGQVGSGESPVCIRTAMEKMLSHTRDLVEDGAVPKPLFLPTVDDLWQCPLTLVDLICYSFQVARGMEFLASRKCIHRDLAARNILLSDNNVVKICDFGLARDIYKDPDYVRKGNARLPLKWMAPESIFDKVYTTQSDVWSFGVLLWEIFSLGVSPYPGVQINEEFCQRLREGTRMRAPEYATEEIYRIMLNSWHGEPKDRPIFSDLVEILGDLLQANVEQDGKDYIPLNMLQAREGELAFSRFQTSLARGDGEMSEWRIRCDSIGPRYYNCLSLPGCTAEGHQMKFATRVKTFEDIPMEQAGNSMQNDNQTDSGMVLAPEELEKMDASHEHQLAFRKASSPASVPRACRLTDGQADRCRPGSDWCPGVHSGDCGHTLQAGGECEERRVQSSEAGLLNIISPF